MCFNTRTGHKSLDEAGANLCLLYCKVFYVYAPGYVFPNSFHLHPNV